MATAVIMAIAVTAAIITTITIITAAAATAVRQIIVTPRKRTIAVIAETMTASINPTVGRTSPVLSEVTEIAIPARLVK